MASVNLEEQANFTRLSRLLVDKGTEALRNTLDAIYPPANLPAALQANKKNLLRLKFKFINSQHWDLLFPPSGNLADSKTFNVTLLTILLRSICGLRPPATGWNTMPLDSDRSTGANITRIKFFRNQLYTHVSSTEVDNAEFEKYWKVVSKVLVELKVPQSEIDELKTCPLSPKEEPAKVVLPSKTLKELTEWFMSNLDDLLPAPKRFIAPYVPPIKESVDLWEWKKTSEIHREKFEKLHEYGRRSPQKIMEINDVRVCLSKEFLINRGSDGTSVFVGLSKDGGERAVKRLVRDDDICSSLAEQEKMILNERNAVKSKYVVKYRFLDKSNPDWLFLIMDLCEETLEEFVQLSNPEDWSKIARGIIRQVLRGLADIHHDPRGILHRDLKPSNIMRDVDGSWLLADFGISRVLTHGKSTYRSKERGTYHWKAVESCSSDGNDVRYKKESDIQVAGMIAFYSLTKGKHPFGEEPDQRRNVLDGNPVYLNKVKNHAANDLISWMLSHEPKDRPLADEALKHPYLASPEQQFKMLCEVGNQREIKFRHGDSPIVDKLKAISGDWQKQVDAKVLKYLCTDFVKGKSYKYGSCWCECLRLIRNVNQHWYDQPRQRPQPVEEFYLVDDPQEYFLNLFPNLPTDVHKIVRSCHWKEKRKLKEYFK